MSAPSSAAGAVGAGGAKKAKTWNDVRMASAPPANASGAMAGKSSSDNTGKAGGAAASVFGGAGGQQKPWPAEAPGSLEADFNYGVHVASCSVDVRMKFIRKVYGIVGAQLLLTTIVTAIFQIPPVTAFIQNFPAGLTLASFLGFATLIAVFVKRHEFPTNMYLLAAFTLAEAYLVGTIVTFYEVQSVLQAAVITTCVVAGLTLFSFQTKYDFTVFNSLLGMLLFFLIGVAFVMMLAPTTDAAEMTLAVFGAFLFSGFIVVDTQRLLYRVSTDEYILCAIDLYLDMINLFIRLLEIFGNRK